MKLSPEHEHLAEELTAAVAEAKRQLVERNKFPASWIEPLLPSHLKRPFWDMLLHDFFAEGDDRNPDPDAVLEDPA